MGCVVGSLVAEGASSRDRIIQPVQVLVIDQGAHTGDVLTSHLHRDVVCIFAFFTLALGVGSFEG